MTWFARKKVLAHLRISRSLSPYNVRKMLNYLRSLRPQNVDALAISIQAGSGDFVQTQLAIEAIDEISKSKMIPVYTFAEDFAIDTAYLLLACGNEVTANPFAIVGDIGRSVKTIAITQLLNKFGVEYQGFQSNPQYSNAFRWWRDQTENEGEFVQKMVNAQAEEFRSIVMEKRGLAIANAQLNEQDLQDVMDGGFYSSVDACKYGLIDKLGTFEEFQRDNFENHKLEEHKLDLEDDFDFDVLELTKSGLPTVKAIYENGSQFGDAQLDDVNGNLDDAFLRMIENLDMSDIEVMTNEISHRMMVDSLSTH